MEVPHAHRQGPVCGETPRVPQVDTQSNLYCLDSDPLGMFEAYHPSTANVWHLKLPGPRSSSRVFRGGCRHMEIHIHNVCYVQRAPHTLKQL